MLRCLLLVILLISTLLEQARCQCCCGGCQQPQIPSIRNQVINVAAIGGGGGAGGGGGSGGAGGDGGPGGGGGGGGTGGAGGAGGIGGIGGVGRDEPQIGNLLLGSNQAVEDEEYMSSSNNSAKGGTIVKPRRQLPLTTERPNARLKMERIPVLGLGPAPRSNDQTRLRNPQTLPRYSPEEMNRLIGDYRQRMMEAYLAAHSPQIGPYGSALPGQQNLSPMTGGGLKFTGTGKFPLNLGPGYSGYGEVVEGKPGAPGRNGANGGDNRRVSSVPGLFKIG